MPPRKRRKRQRPQTSARRMLPMTKRRKAVRLKAVNLQLERRVVRLLPQQKMAPNPLESLPESLPPNLLLLESPVRERPVRTVQRLKARMRMAVVLSRRLLMLARQARTRPRKKRRKRRPKRKGRPN